MSHSLDIGNIDKENGIQACVDTNCHEFIACEMFSDLPNKIYNVDLRKVTIIIIHWTEILVVFIIDPALNGNKISHKTGNFAF